MRGQMHLLMIGTALAGTSAYAQTVAPGPVVASTQAPQGDDDGGGDIIVTAQKRSERLNDVPISITAASGDTLAKRGINSPSDLGQISPGFSYQRSSWGVPIYSIRGIGLYNTYAGMSPTVTVYVDQQPLPFLLMAQGAALDVERVEVLKGPQGTLFGQNSTGGAINYIASKPTADLHAGFDLSYGRFNQVDAQGFISGPLSDTLSARVAVRHEYRSPWQRSETRPGDRLGERDFTVGRILLDWKPSDRTTFELNLNGWRDRSDSIASKFLRFCASGGTNCVGGYPDSIALATRPRSPDNARIADWDPGVDFAKDERLYQAALTGTVELSDNFTLSSLSSFVDYKTLAPNDPDGTDLNTFRLTIDARIRTFSQEFRVAADLADRVKLTVGANYEHDNIRNDDVGQFTSSNSGVGPARYSTFRDRADQRVSTYAAFASVDYKLTPTLTAQGGIRYTKQDRDFSGCILDGGDGQLAAAFDFLRTSSGFPSVSLPNGACVSFADATFRPVPAEIQSSLNQNNLSWRAGLNWKPVDEVMLYANVTKGYKSGAYQALPAVFADQLTPVTQESVLAYEAGFKAQTADRKYNMTGAVFYYDYKNKQLEAFRDIPPFGNQPALANIPKSRVWGLETEITARPVRNLTLSAGGTYVNSKVSSDFLGPDPFGAIFNYRGRAFPNTPKWQFLGDAEYGIPVSSGSRAYVGASIMYRSSTPAQFVINDADFIIRRYALLDLRAGVETTDGKLRLQIWGKNVTNKYYTIQALHLPDTVVATPGMPATYGVTLSYRY
jgi:iron complex outermembrane receptor protein